MGKHRHIELTEAQRIELEQLPGMRGADQGARGERKAARGVPKAEGSDA